MQVHASESVLFIAGLVFGPVALISLLLGLNALLAPRRPGGAKAEAFECGIPQAASPWRSVNLRFATIALLFVILDAETILLLGVATQLRGSLTALIEVGAFVGFLAFGLLYAWKKGALRWPA
jgi:NADH-quinone oxidoreductase subunit A